MESLGEREALWLRRVAAAPGCFGWEPSDIDVFGRLLLAAWNVTSGRRFLEVGCGIGTKMQLAESLGFSAYGIEILPELVAEARNEGLDVVEADARSWRGYAEFDTVYVNHPLLDSGAEEAFERELHQAMKPRSVLVAVNDCGPPADWKPVIDERAAWRGVWVKPWL